MSQCYKCGRELPGAEMECEPGECISRVPTDDEALDRDLPVPEQYDDSKWCEIDWDKIKTLEDLKLVMRTGACELFIHVNDPGFDQVKRFLKEKKP